MAGNWGDNKVCEALTLRAAAEINRHLSGNECGYASDKSQVTRVWLDWPYSDICQLICGTSHLANLVHMVSSMEAVEDVGKPSPTCSSGDDTM